MATNVAQNAQIDDFPDEPSLNASLSAILLCVSLCLALLVLLLWCMSMFFLHKASKERRRTTPASQASRDLFTTLARLALLSYCDSRVSQDSSGRDITEPLQTPSHVDFHRQDGTVEVFVRGCITSFQSTYYVLQTYANNSVWLLAPRHPGFIQAKWIIVFRGTRVLEDIVSDFKLTVSVGSESNFGLREAQRSTYRLLTGHVFSNYNIQNTDSIVLVGHSLGATIAEMMLLRLKERRFTAVSAYCFDTPGLPQWMRNEYAPLEESIRPELTLIYAHDNMVNNLTSAPPNAVCYRAGKGEPLAISNVLLYLTSVPRFLAALRVIVFESLNSHNLETLAMHLEEGDYEHDIAVSARRCSGVLLRSLFRITRPIISHSRSKPPSRGPDHNISPREFYQEGSGINDLTPFPGVEEAVRVFLENRREDGTLIRPVPYAVGEFSTFSNKLSRYNDVVLPFVGLTAVGKTSLIKAIFNIVDDDLLPVSATMNTTSESCVMLWKIIPGEGGEYTTPAEDSQGPTSEMGAESTQKNPLLQQRCGSPPGSQTRSRVLRVWLMDMRGVDAASASIVRNEQSETVQSQLHHMRTVVQAACYVTGTPTRESRKLFEEVSDAVNGRVFVVRNYHETVFDQEEKNKLREEANEVYENVIRGKKVPGNLTVILTKVYRCVGATEENRRDEENIGKLKEELTKWVLERRKEISNGINSARAQADGAYYYLDYAETALTSWDKFSDYFDPGQYTRIGRRLNRRYPVVYGITKIGIGSCIFGLPGAATVAAAASVGIALGVTKFYVQGQKRKIQSGPTPEGQNCEHQKTGP